MSRESMEKLNIEKKREELEWGWNELEKLVNEHKEAKKKKGDYDPCLAVVELRDLDKEKDGDIFRKYKRDIWTEAEFQTYTDAVTKDLEEKGNNSRDNFRDWLAEKARIKFQREDSINKLEQA